jgi:hypothetical protein
MKINQVVSEHKKGVRAMKYGKKTKGAVPVYGPDAKNVAKLQPVKPVGPGADKKDVKEDLSNVTVKPITGAQEVDVNGQKIATATDATAAATIAQLAKDGKISAPTGNNNSNPMEEGPEIPYYVELGPNGPMAKTGGRGTTQIVASKLWTAITPEIEAKADSQGYRKVMLQHGGRQFPGLEGGDQKLGSKIIVAPSDYQSMMSPNANSPSRPASVPSAPPMKEADDELLEKMRTIAGLR